MTAIAWLLGQLVALLVGARAGVCPVGYEFNGARGNEYECRESYVGPDEWPALDAPSLPTVRGILYCEPGERAVSSDRYFRRVECRTFVLRDGIAYPR